MFIHWAPTALFACTFMNTLFTSAAAATFYCGSTLLLAVKRPIFPLKHGDDVKKIKNGKSQFPRANSRNL